MSVCVENTVLANQATSTQISNDAPAESKSQQQTDQQQQQHSHDQLQVAQLLQPTSQQQQSQSSHQQQQQPLPPLQQQQQPTTVRTITKIPATNAALSKASFITVLNAPLGNVKSLCVTPSVSSGQFTVVNSAAPLNISNNNPAVKPQTITLINTPVTVVKTISPGGGHHHDKSVGSVQDGAHHQLAGGPGVVAAPVVPALIENRGHNVFVKNTTEGAAIQGQEVVPQSHKLLTANNFPTNNVITTAINMTDVGVAKTVNGQRNKVKILSNVLMPGPSQPTSNILINKAPSGALPQRYVPRQKLVASNNGATTKYVNRGPNNMVTKPNMVGGPVVGKQQQMPSQTAGMSQSRVVYPTHKSQIKTIPPVNNYIHAGGKMSGGIKTLPPHARGIPAPIQRTGSGLRTIPPQRPQKMPNKPNYIGKHAVQAQKLKPTHKLKSVKTVSPAAAVYNCSYHSSAGPVQEKQLTFNQALTAEILETLGNGKSGSSCTNSSYSTVKQYEILPRCEGIYYSGSDIGKSLYDQPIKQPMESNKSGLDALSLICQAVLLDHNYNATLPTESSPPRTAPPINAQAQLNGGVSCNTMYSPSSTGKRRSLSTSNPISAATSLSNLSSSIPSNSTSMIQDDDAASDISDGSDRKHDTEGEETDTAPECEGVNEEQFGDYTTRCICGFVHDDGYMIECDRCKVWQHVQCVIKNKQVPDDYLCEVCDPQKLYDRNKAKMVQQQWLRDRQFAEPKVKKETKLKETFKHKETLSDTDTSDGEVPNHNNNVMSKGRTTLMNRRKSDGHQKANNARQRRDSAKETVQRRPKKREKKLVKRKPKAQVKNHSDDENHDSVNSSTPLPQFRQWLEQYEEATTNHYSPELRARISNIRVNGAHSEMAVQLDTSVEKCRVHTQPLTNIKHLYSAVHLPPNTPVVELRGKYMLSTQHRTSGSTLNTRQHAQRPGPFVFFYRLHKENTEVCVDTRTYGNSARFIRRSCKPNAELRHSIVKSALHLYIVTIANVDKNVELTIKHESHDLAAIGTTHIACACGNTEECTVNRSTIKKNGDSTDIHKKRRGRRTVSLSAEPEPSPPTTNTRTAASKKEQQQLPAILPPPIPPVSVKTEVVEDDKVEPEKTVIKIEPEEDLPKETPEVKEEKIEEKKLVEEDKQPLLEPKKEVKESSSEEEVEKALPSAPAASLTPLIAAAAAAAAAVTVAVPPVPPPSSTVNRTPSPVPTVISTRRSSSHHKNQDKDDSKESDSSKEASPPPAGESKNKNKKLSREERKLEAILRAIAQMEKADQRKQEHQAKQAHRRESEPSMTKEEVIVEPKLKRKRKKGRARTQSTNTQSNRRNRLNSTDSYMTSGDETMLSPHEVTPPTRPCLKDQSSSDLHGEPDKDAGLLLALSNGGGENKHKSPHRDGGDSTSNSVQSSPETHVSSACLLVQAAVEPMEPGFKFPKTKKGLMNEWLNKVPEPVQSASSISPSSLTPHINSTTPNVDFEPSFYTPGKSLVALAQVASFCDTNLQQPPRGGGSAKKRWLRQAISEDQCDSPSGRPESPPLSDSVAPPKKRRLPRESLSNDNTPPTTPTTLIPSSVTHERQQAQEGCVEIVYSGADDDSPSQILESDAVLEERAAEMKEEFSKFQHPQLKTEISAPRPLIDVPGVSCLMDPRLARSDHPHHHVFSNSEHLVGTVEKTLSILGFEDRKPEPITPAKRKLSISEYRQRKRVNTNDKGSEEQTGPEENVGAEENNSSESFKPLRSRSDSTSSCTSMTSSDDETAPLEVAGKALSAFNSEPTELERQREITSMRLKKAFGIPVDQEPRKPALDVEAILNCEIPPVVKTIPPSPNFPIPGSCGDGSLTRVSPSFDAISSPNRAPSVAPEQPQVQHQQILVPVAAAVPVTITKVPVPELLESKDLRIKDDVKPMFYTPDEEERRVKNVNVESEEQPPVDYVPPFNNPIYPNDSNFTPYASVIDEEGRYEGRNPSPPPELEGAGTFEEQQT